MSPDPRTVPPYLCDPERACITCSDEGIAMRLLEWGADRGLALCADEEGRRSEVMIALIEGAAIGDVLLVHAGTAIARLERAPGREAAS